MQNSLDRLLAGMAAALRDTVAPHVTDSFAKAQLAACVELLGNIATRASWDDDQLIDVAVHVDRELAAARAADPALAAHLDAVAPTTPPVDALARRDAALAELGAALRWIDEQPTDSAARGPLLAATRWHLDHELALLRTGMFTS